MPIPLAVLLPLAVGQGPGCGPGGCPPTHPSGFVGPNYPRPAAGGAAAGRYHCPPSGPPAPLLTAAVSAPAGVKVGLYDGAGKRTFAAPVTAGLRPGYAYRFELADLPGHPGEALYPVLEVHGSLVPRPAMNPADHPAPVVVSQADIDRAFAGVLITKVIYLEDPEAAVPAEVRPGDPYEAAHPTFDDAYKTARTNGRVVAVLRLGDRRPGPDELARNAVANTVLCPGDGRLAAPPVPPPLAWAAVTLYDPLHGPRPATEECVVDGGDKGARLGVGPDGRVGGLDPTDVAAEYTQRGVRKVTTSNVVCLCVPRFGVRRADLGAAGVRVAAGPDRVIQAVGRVVASNRQPVLAVAQREKPVEANAAVRARAEVGAQGVGAFVRLTRPSAVATSQGLLQVASVVGPDEITSMPDLLVVTKAVSPPGPHRIGQEVEFAIRYRNNTRAAVSDVVVSDSLSGRLAYVPGSAASDRPSNVTTGPNEAGSEVVRFELPGVLAPGQGGVVTFRAVIR